MAKFQNKDGLDLGAHSSDFEDTAEKERQAQTTARELQTVCEDRKRKCEEMEQRYSALENQMAQSEERQCAVLSKLEKEREELREEKIALQNKLVALRADREAEASNASFAQAECQRLREEKVALKDELAALITSRDAEASNATLAQDEHRKALEENTALQDELTALTASRDAEAKNAALAQDGWQKVREENTALRAEIVTMRASQNAAATLSTTERRPEVPEEHTPAQRITEEPDMAAVSLPMKALKGKDSNGNLVYLEIASLGDRLQRELSQLVPEWQAIAKKKWKRKSWDEMTKAILAAPNQCALDKVDNTGACLWTRDDRQLFACRKSANNGRYCVRPYQEMLLLLPLPPDARGSNDPTQPGYYKVEVPGTLSKNKTVWNLWESGSKG